MNPQRAMGSGHNCAKVVDAASRPRAISLRWSMGYPLPIEPRMGDVLWTNRLRSMAWRIVDWIVVMVGLSFLLLHNNDTHFVRGRARQSFPGRAIPKRPLDRVAQRRAAREGRGPLASHRVRRTLKTSLSGPASALREETCERPARVAAFGLS